MRALLLAATVAAALSAPAQAAEDAHTRALAAGYKAAFLCSGVFNAGRPEAEIAADDLEGIYPEYQELVRTLPATVDREAKTVSVAFDPKLPPRIAAWRPNLGCAQLAVGAPASAVSNLPRVALKAPDLKAKAWPHGDADATAAGPAALAPLLAQAFDAGAYGGKTTAVLVIRDGKIIGEQYRPGYDLYTPQRTWSAAKSLTATLIGRAVWLGKAKVEAPANVPEWQTPGDPRAAITLSQLMHMGSGLWTDGPGNRTDDVYVGGGLVTQWATHMPIEAAPGARFRYANNDTLLAARSLRASLGDGQDALEFPFEELLWRVGMTHTTPEADAAGNYILSSQVWTTARDLGRLGLLYLNDGRWNGERVLPEGWSAFAATPAPAQPEKGPRYGAFFWLYGPEQGLPPLTYGMNGNRGQYVFIVPAKKVVIVRRGFDSPAARFDEQRFARDVLKALE
jgi:CubicO group peptidase (beta-lactamase class C family)